MQRSAWVGQFDRTTLVFDPDMQMPDCPHVFLWNTTSLKMEKYVPNLVRTKVKTQRDPEVVSSSLTAFQSWKLAEATSWLESERPYYRARREGDLKAEGKKLAEAHAHARAEAERLEAMATLSERHRVSGQDRGGIYLGVRAAGQGRQKRVTHCYSCKMPLDNSVNLECVACGWILCLCSACGCGYSGVRSDY